MYSSMYMCTIVGSMYLYMYMYMYTIVYFLGSMYSHDNSPLVLNGGSLVQRVTPRNTPTLQLPVSNNSSPRVPKRGLYPDLV